MSSRRKTAFTPSNVDRLESREVLSTAAAHVAGIHAAAIVHNFNPFTPTPIMTPAQLATGFTTWSGGTTTGTAPRNFNPRVATPIMTPAQLATGFTTWHGGSTVGIPNYTGGHIVTHSTGARVGAGTTTGNPFLFM